MGGCASRPKDFDAKHDAVPVEAPTSPVKAEAEKPATETTNDGGETEKEKEEEPLVDVSEPKPTAETESAAQEPAPATAEAEEKKVGATTAVEAKSQETVDGSSDKKEAEQAKTAAPLITI